MGGFKEIIFLFLKGAVNTIGAFSLLFSLLFSLARVPSLDQAGLEVTGICLSPLPPAPPSIGIKDIRCSDTWVVLFGFNLLFQKKVSLHLC